MSTVARACPLIDDAVLAEVVTGLRQTPKQLPCKLFYDEAGAALFDQICTLPEYYPTRTELGILRAHVGAMAEWIGERARIVEYGSGSGEKTRILLRALADVAEYVPIDIARQQLEQFAQQLREEMPGLCVRPISADYTQPLSVSGAAAAQRTVVFFPGSTIGNFHPAEALQFLRNIAKVAGPAGGLLIGVDLRKDRPTLERAYDDAAGVTAAFNLNILTHINRLCDANFDVREFRHRAFYDEVRGRIEMHLVSQSAQCVTFAKSSSPLFLTLVKGETIVTEYSYKYTVAAFQKLACCAGYAPAAVWTDRQERFSVLAFEVR